MPERFGLYVVMTDPAVGYEACAEAAVAQEIRYLQLRMKNAPRERVLEKARAIRTITRGSRTRFIVNDDVTVAMESDADGVHLGRDDLPVDEARALWRDETRVFGLSTHNERQARAAQRIRPSYIGVGPVFATPTKAKPDPVLGLSRMGAIVRSSPLTTVAIGGIDLSNLGAVLAHGAINFCAVRAIMRSPDPSAVMRTMMDAWKAKAGP